MTFTVKNEDKKARIADFKLKNTTVETPYFMPVATKTAFKNVTVPQIKQTGTQCFIANAFLISLKPGDYLLEDFGGIHKWMNWDGGIFTDSGGFQLLSEYFVNSLSDEGVVFTDPYTGGQQLFTPEDSMKVQERIGADVAMAFDDVPHYGKSEDYIKGTVERTTKWAKRCIKAHTDKTQKLFGIVQGGTFPHLRAESAKQLAELPFDGFALGGLAIGESDDEQVEAVNVTVENLPRDKPLYFMGLGTPDHIIECIGLGVDIFDSIYPTSSARHGAIFTQEGAIKIHKKKYLNDFGPLDEKYSCPETQNVTRGYLCHLFNVDEEAAKTLASIHNVNFVQSMIAEAKEHIKAGTFYEFKDKFLSRYLTAKNKAKIARAEQEARRLDREESYKKHIEHVKKMHEKYGIKPKKKDTEDMDKGD